MKLQKLPTVLLLIMAFSAQAEVTLDGSLGRSGALPGPDYQIGADLGQQHGSNLFHSFQDFNLNSAESATFSGPNSVQNVLSRVTGGNPSNIDGLIRSTIPNANMYFLNPYGILFGPNARLDVQGSFHASTADYLRLGNGGRFDARNPSESILTVAPIESFGFLTNTPASITTQDSNLFLREGKTLSLIGGDLTISGEISEFQPNAPGIPAEAHSNMLVESGRINLISNAAIGEINLTESGINSSTEQQSGTIAMESTFLSVSGSENGGSIFIRAGELLVLNSTIKADTYGVANGKGIDISIDNLYFKGVELSTSTFGSGHGGDVHIQATGLVKLDGIKDARTNIVINTENSEEEAGNGGSLTLEARELVLNYSAITSDSWGAGQGGNITVKVTGPITISGVHDEINGEFSTTYVSADAYYQGDGGFIELTAEELYLLKNGEITTYTEGEGQAGNIYIKIGKIVEISGEGSNIETTSFGMPPPEFQEDFEYDLEIISTKRGNAGNLFLESGQLNLKKGGYIAAGSAGDFAGKGGTINIDSSQINLTEGGFIISSTLSTEEAGSINIVTDALTISGQIGAENNSDIAAIFGGSSSILSHSVRDINGAGDAGEIVIQANTIKLEEDTQINTSTQNAAGGNILINTSNLLYLRNGQITTSVQGGKGDGGNMTIKNPTFVVMDKGKIIAQADAGHGGNIRIVAEQFIKSPESLVSASSRLGLDGDVNIESPEVDMNAMMAILPSGYVEAELPKGCHQIKDLSELSTFRVISGGDGLPRTPQNYQE